MIKVIAPAALLLLAGGVAAAGSPPQLTVTPQRGLIDAPFHVVLRNLLPGVRVTVTASRPDA
ncbi:MAG: hypothetical protein ACREP9_09015, partial [Candidatus Dormibacteraceae bacterium]